MFKRRSYLRGVVVLLLSLLLVWAMACAGPPRQQGPAGPPAPAAVITLTPVSIIDIRKSNAICNHHEMPINWAPAV